MSEMEPISHFQLSQDHNECWVWVCKFCQGVSIDCDSVGSKTLYAEERALAMHVNTDFHQSQYLLHALANERKP